MLTAKQIQVWQIELKNLCRTAKIESLKDTLKQINSLTGHKVLEVEIFQTAKRFFYHEKKKW